MQTVACALGLVTLIRSLGARRTHRLLLLLLFCANHILSVVPQFGEVDLRRVLLDYVRLLSRDQALEFIELTERVLRLRLVNALGDVSYRLLWPCKPV